VETGAVTIPAGPGEWDPHRLQQLVTQHDLERARIEYKSELGNGNKTLEAIAALANTFGGVVLVGVDESKQGTDRLTGVDTGERDRLARMCWDNLVPPYSPEIVPIKLDPGDRYVLAVLVDPDYARRPVMLTQGNKVPVRLEGHNVPADWYRLRELFAEQQATTPRPALPPSGNFVPTPGTPHPDLGIRGRLLLTGPRGRTHHITESARNAILAALNSNDTPLTGTQSTLVALMHTWMPGPWGSDGWRLHGRASTHLLNAQWKGLTPSRQCLTEARLTMELTPATAAQGTSLTITLEGLLTNPRRAILGDQFKEKLGSPDDRDASYLAELDPTPLIHLDGLRRVMLDTLATLWGPLGIQASTGILDQPLGPPAQLDLAVFTAAKDIPSQISINQCVDFGTARLIPGNTPLPWTQLDPIEPDHQLFDRPDQEHVAHDWLIWIGLHNGYQNIDQELARLAQP